MSTAGGRSALLHKSVIERLDRQYRGIPYSHRPLLWQIATSASHRAHRDWIEAEFAALSPKKQAEVRTVALDHNLLVGLLSELAVAHVLRDAGLHPVSGPQMGRLTPDIYLPGNGDTPPVIAEVWTRSLPRDRLNAVRQWAHLATMIEAVPRPVGVSVHSFDHTEPLPPSSAQVKALAAPLREWLLGRRSPAYAFLDAGGYRFVVEGDDPHGQIAGRLLSPAAPSATSADDVIENIRVKARKYKALARAEGAALVVVVASEPGASLDRDMVARTLEGKNVMSISIDMFGSGTTPGRRVELRQEESAPRFDPALSAVAWVDVLNSPTPHLTLWSLPTAIRPISLAETDHLTVERPIFGEGAKASVAE